MIGAVEKTLQLKASPDRVWKALTDPAELGRWFPDRTDLEPAMGREGWFDWEAHGKYAVRIDAIEHERRLVWTWAREANVELMEAPRTTVEWRLEPRADGGTTLHLRESGFVSETARDQNDSGWDHELDELLEYLGEAGEKEAVS